MHSTPAHAAPRPFSRSMLGHLCDEDRSLFERYGQGPRVAIAHVAIHHAFEARAAAAPDAIAARHLDAAITYAELDAQANRLARHLAAHGIGPGDAVPLFLQRGIAMLVGILATLKLGAAYVPQHLGVAPPEHLRHVVEACEARVVLTLSALETLVPRVGDTACIAIDAFMAQADDAARAPFVPAREIRGDDRCFILFTSGTTGVPNGVQVTHANVCNILLSEPGSLGMRPGAKVAQLLNIAFDMAAWETLGSLAHGAELVIRGKDFQAVAECVDVIVATPSILATIDARRCRNVRVVAVAGEPCPRPLADEWAAFCAFHNSCGPTETTIVNTAQRYTRASERLTIGRPTPNNTVYVLDEHLLPCAIGEVGEMWAGGDCVSAGYLRDEVLTRERYLPDPFLGGTHRMFRTRDLGRWTPDGELEHLGRVDDQVKVLGFRVELDSVSHVIERAPGCLQAATLKLDQRRLVAFVRPASVDTETLRRRVAEALPYYCVPAFILALDEFPITSRGKVDKRALMARAAAHDEQALRVGGEVSR